ncbi:MAG TPA: CDP-archaeol synthase, partial [Methylococcaceae bacterium]|nr:CDP-archaeol synthase [Methylococcaceae bacterium]
SDGRPLFGRSKTWRGIVSSIGLVSAVSWSMSYGLAIGVAFGGLAMIGDLSASYIKRRQGMVESSRARGLDTIPESLLPAVLLKSQLGLNGLEISVVVLLFFMIEEFVSPILYRLNIRKRPY